MKEKSEMVGCLGERLDGQSVAAVVEGEGDVFLQRVLQKLQRPADFWPSNTHTHTE